ncbi:MAG: helix-turn-helix domain-containing protein [Candidatus Schekmanbacteria bacterium]|nr:helix-turn-helix domain-containing protein [Candidatus Schekmanbacteria bacterium]
MTSMIIRKAFKYELKTNKAIKHKLRRVVGCARFVWNRALAIQLECLGASEKLLGYAELCALLTVWRNDPATAFLAECPVHTQQQTLRDLSRALHDGLSKSSAERMPRFKKKGRDLDSFRYPDPKQLKLESGRVFLPKIGWVRYRDSRPAVGTAAVITVSRRRSRANGKSRRQKSAVCTSASPTPATIFCIRSQAELSSRLRLSSSGISRSSGRRGCQGNADNLQGDGHEGA